MDKRAKEGIQEARKMLAAKGGKRPDTVTLVVWGRDGDPKNNAVAQKFADKGVPVFGLRFHETSFRKWLADEMNAGRNRSKDDAQTLTQSWLQDTWHLLPDHALTPEGLKYKQRWVDGRWVNLM